MPVRHGEFRSHGTGGRRIEYVRLPLWRAQKKREVNREHQRSPRKIVQDEASKLSKAPRDAQKFRTFLPAKQDRTGITRARDLPRAAIQQMLMFGRERIAAKLATFNGDARAGEAA
jgi:hypothetical protein